MNKLMVFTIAISLSLLLVACSSTPPAYPTVQVVFSETSAAVETSAAIAEAAGGSIPDAGPELAWLMGQSREDDQGAVTVKVAAENVDAIANTIEFNVVMDTHSVDLNMDLALLSTLATDTGLTVNGIWDGPLGGHHVEGTLSFPISVNGTSVLDGANTLTLTIRDVDTPERTFSWQR